MTSESNEDDLAQPDDPILRDRRFPARLSDLVNCHVDVVPPDTIDGSVRAAIA